jgi:hypothetical protein
MAAVLLKISECAVVQLPAADEGSKEGTEEGLAEKRPDAKEPPPCSCACLAANKDRNRSLTLHSKEIRSKAWVVLEMGSWSGRAGEVVVHAWPAETPPKPQVAAARRNDEGEYRSCVAFPRVGFDARCMTYRDRVEDKS